MITERITECKGFRWMPGMLDAEGGWRLVYEVGIRGKWEMCRVVEDPTGGYSIETTCSTPSRPDFTDTVTRGCLLELVRKAWNDPTISTVADAVDLWSVRGNVADVGYCKCGDTEERALVFALQAAPAG